MKRSDTKEQILAKAKDIFARKGLQATSIDDIISACGITKGGFYHHFQNKEQLCLEAIDAYKVDLLKFLDSRLVPEKPTESLSDFFDGVLLLHQERNFVGGCPFGNIALETADESPAYAGRVLEVFGEWQKKLEMVLRSAKKLRKIRSELPPEALAAHIVMAIEGGTMLSRLSKSEQPLANCLATLRQIIAVDNP